MAEQLPPELLASCDTNHGPMLLIFGWLFLAITIITVFLRLYFRYFYRNGLHMDDVVMLASLISGIIAVSWLNVLVNAGLGQHIYCLPPQQIPTAVHASILGQIFNILGIGLVKVSVCLTVLRIIDRGVSPLLKLFIWTLLVFACLSHGAQILLFIIQCRPMRAIWDVSLVREGKARCFSSHITYLAGYIGFGLDAFTDLACSAIPIVIVNRLHLNPRTKTALCLLMGLGSLTAACAIAKAVTLRGVFADDYTYELTNPAICTILEHLCGMILASLPALRPLVRQLLEGVSSGKRVSSTPSQHHNDRNNNKNHYYYYNNNKHMANGAAARAGAGGSQHQHKSPALPLSPHSSSCTTNNLPRNLLPPQAPALALSTPRSLRFPVAATAGGGRTSDKKNRQRQRRQGSRTSWWAIPADRKSWRKSVAAPPEMMQAAPPPPTKKKSSFSFMSSPGGSDGDGMGVRMGLGHWRSHPLHHHHQRHHGKSSDGMGSQDTTIVGGSSCSPGTTPGVKDQFSALETKMVEPVPNTSLLRPEEEEEGEEVVGEQTKAKGRGKGEEPATAAAMGQITRTISFRVSSEHYSDSHDGVDGDVEGQRRTDTTQGGGGGRRSHQHQEWPLNPLSPVDGVSPWYVDDEVLGGSPPHEHYLRARGWHNRDF